MARSLLTWCTAPKNALDVVLREAATKVGLICGALRLTTARPSAPSSSRVFPHVSRDPLESSKGLCFPPPSVAVAGRHELEWPVSAEECPERGIGDLLNDGLLWAVPKRKTSRSKKRMRMAHKYLKPKHHFYPCPACGNLKLQHVLCEHCFRETMKKTAEVRKQLAAEKNADSQGQRRIETDEEAVSN